MSKIVKYLVSGEEVRTLREVSDILGKKVTKAMIKSGEVPEVVIEEVEDEVDTVEDEGSARIYVGEDTYEELPLTNPLQPKEETAVDGDTSLTAEEEAKIEEIINSEEDEDNEEDIDGVEDEDNDDNTSDNDEPSDSTDNDTGSNSGSNLDSLRAKMKELNAKKQAESSSQTTTSKGSRTKTVQFTGEYPEVGFFKEKKVLQKFYKQLTEEQLDDWLELEGLTYNKSDNEPINRMRKCMAILALHFPSENKGSSKKKSKYADYTTEQLLEIALENDVEVKEAKGNDERILRMYTIMALKKAGILN